MKSRLSLARMKLGILVDEAGISADNIAMHTGLASSTVSSFLYGNGTPQDKTIKAIEKFIAGKKSILDMYDKVHKLNKD